MHQKSGLTWGRDVNTSTTHASVTTMTSIFPLTHGGAVVLGPSRFSEVRGQVQSESFTSIAWWHSGKHTRSSLPSSHRDINNVTACDIRAEWLQKNRHLCPDFWIMASTVHLLQKNRINQMVWVPWWKGGVFLLGVIILITGHPFIDLRRCSHILRIAVRSNWEELCLKQTQVCPAHVWHVQSFTHNVLTSL